MVATQSLRLDGEAHARTTSQPLGVDGGAQASLPEVTPGVRLDVQYSVRVAYLYNGIHTLRSNPVEVQRTSDRWGVL